MAPRVRREAGSAHAVATAGVRAAVFAAAARTRQAFAAPVFAAQLSSPPQSSPLGPDSIEITIAGGRTVRVSADVDTAALVRIIDALEA